MIDRDAHVGALDTSPSYRHHLHHAALICALNQSLIGKPRLLHNHPSGDPTPSTADIDMTRRLVEAGDKLGLKVHDHIIIGRNGHASFRTLKLI